MMSKIIPTKPKTKSTNSVSKPLVSPIPTFIRKTYDILQNNKHPQIVSWNSDGTALIIHNPEAFASQVLPNYFKHNQLTSFVRQLNLYNFHKRKTPKEDHIYHHDLFQRDKKHLLKGIKRRSQGLNFESIQKNIEAMNPATTTSRDVSGLSYENKLLANFHKETQSRINALENHVKDLTIQNQALWNEVSHQDEREGVLKDFIRKVMTAFGGSSEEITSQLMLEDAPQATSTVDLSRKKALDEVFNAKGGACATCVDVGCLINAEEVTESTEAESHASPAKTKTRKLDLDLTESLPIISDLLAKVSEKLKEQDQDEKGKKSPETDDLWENGYQWSLETEYLNRIGTLHRAYDESFLSENTSDMLGKRGFSDFVSKIERVKPQTAASFLIFEETEEEIEESRKMVHVDQEEYSHQE